MTPFNLQEAKHREKYSKTLPNKYFAMIDIHRDGNSLEMIELTMDEVSHFDKNYILVKNGFLPIIAKRNETIDIDLSVESGV